MERRASIWRFLDMQKKRLARLKQHWVRCSQCGFGNYVPVGVGGFRCKRCGHGQAVKIVPINSVKEVICKNE